MIHKTYEIACRLYVLEAVEQIKTLLSEEHVKYRATEFSVITTQTLIAILGFQPQLYSRKNWVGLNPFAFVSGVDIQCESSEHGFTRVIVRVNRLRGFVWTGFWVGCSALAASAMPASRGAALVVGVACTVWLGIVSFLGGYLLKKEIGDNLNDGRHRH